ncbi:MAG: FAD-dependent oxidoreductase, partial [Candidatus Omnitrophota bacterium]
MKKIPVNPKELEAHSRIASFEEVVSCYTEAEAREEAKRCLQCKDPTCIAGCPVGIDIKKFILQISERDYKGAYLTIKEKNNFPSMCGRVCPAEYQCRKTCVLTKKGSPFASENAINIHFLERFAGDWGRDVVGLNGTVSPSGDTVHFRTDNVSVAVVGSGPAGLCCAGELARAGIKVVIFESLHKPGGVLRYGIPSFRLPQDVLDFEINYLKKLGVEIRTNTIIGKAETLDELFKEGFSCVFLGLGAGTPSFLGVSGENLCNVYSANEFLTRVNLMGAFRFPEYHTPINIGKRVVVIGGGNTAMDAARVALRLQKINPHTKGFGVGVKPDVAVLYRRAEKEMPARRPEIEHAREEGIKFEFLVQPVGFAGNKEGCVEKIKSLKCKLGEPDSSGRRRPIPIKESVFERACDIAIIAVGLRANRMLTKVTPEI